MLAEVKAKNLRPGDVLYGEKVDDMAQWTAAFIQSQALMALLERFGGEYFRNHSAFVEDSHRIEHVSHGPFRARIVLGRGAVVRIGRNRIVAVYRGKDSYL